MGAKAVSKPTGLATASIDAKVGGRTEAGCAPVRFRNVIGLSPRVARRLEEQTGAGGLREKKKKKVAHAVT